MEKKPIKISGAVKAVDNVTLEIHEGERVGIIGRNGAGKSTLLRMVAGLAKPTYGDIDIGGAVSCIMTLGEGLRQELTGRDNIILDAEINGRSKKEIEPILENIIQFADIGNFIDLPVRTYSSGMKARLSFAMITFISPEILIVDEALSVGDAQFNKKSAEKMKEICSRGKILILVSHSMPAIISLCERCIWLDNGQIVMDGNPKLVTDAYLDAIRKTDEKTMIKKLKSKIFVESFYSGLNIRDPYFIDHMGRSKQIFYKGETMMVHVDVSTPPQFENANITISFIRMDGIQILSSTLNNAFSNLSQTTHNFCIPMRPVLLGKGTYEVIIEIVASSDNSQNEPRRNVLAKSKSILGVENPEYSYENPVYWHPSHWSYEQITGE
jgi:lipopolysaccharide transport system ATP-binding protein